MVKSTSVQYSYSVEQRDFTATQPFVIGVCGGSGSGKTTFCADLVTAVGADRVIHLRQDDYYRDLSHLSEGERAQINFDHPSSVEFELLKVHIHALVSGQAIHVPEYDFATHTRTCLHKFFRPKPVILVEGILLFSVPELLTLFDKRIFIDAPDAVRFSRRLRRDVRERGRTPESIQWQYQTTVRPMHDKYVEPGKHLADLLVSGTSPFERPLQELCLLLAGKINA